MVLIPGEDQVVEDGAVHNGGHEELQGNGSKVCTSFLLEDFKFTLGHRLTEHSELNHACTFINLRKEEKTRRY